jgi:hypothetical protein
MTGVAAALESKRMCLTVPGNRLAPFARSLVAGVLAHGVSGLLTRLGQPALRRPPRTTDHSAMPTIARIAGFSVMIFRNDHDPPHFHVFGADFSALYLNWELARAGQPPQRIED